MTRWCRWPSYQAWRLLRRSPPRVRDLVLPYFRARDVLHLKITTLQEQREKADNMERVLLAA
ncbi:hypothetical protein LCGC14_2480470, partial [marine sediment metagenome]